jgi:uncharacterized protein
MEFLTVPWTSLHNVSFQLARDIEGKNNKQDLIVAIARGGMTIAHMLSDFLSLPVATFTISSYKDMQQTKLSDISFHVGGELAGKKILLVDDISDSGKTFIRGTEYLKGLGVTSIITAAPYIKPWTKHLPDHYVEKTDKWVVLPYEARETIEAVASLLKKEGKTQNDIIQKLKGLGISEDFINTYLIHV